MVRVAGISFSTVSAGWKPNTAGAAKVLAARGYSADLRKALYYTALNGGKPGWVEIYKIIELLKRNVSHKWMDHRHPGISKRIKATADHQDLSGDQARHATMPGTPDPSLAISLMEAQAVVTAWVIGWAYETDWAAGETGPTTVP